MTELARLRRRVIDDHVAEVLAECENRVDALDEASDIKTAFARCPEHFTTRQRQAVQRRLLAAYLRAIGRA